MVTDNRVVMKFVFLLTFGGFVGLINATDEDFFCECTHDKKMVVSFPSEPIDKQFSCPDKVSTPTINQAWFGLESVAICQKSCKDEPLPYWINVTNELQKICSSELGCNTKLEEFPSLTEVQDTGNKFWYICFECPNDHSMKETTSICRKHKRPARSETRDSFSFYPRHKDVTEGPVEDFHEIQSAREMRKFQELSQAEKTKFGLKLLKAKLAGSIPGQKVEGRIFKRPQDLLEEFLRKSEHTLGLLSGALQPNETIDVDFDSVGSFSILRRDNQQYGVNVFHSFKDVNLPDQPSLRTQDNSLLAGVIKYNNSIVKEISNTGNIAALQSIAIFDSNGNVVNQNLKQAITLHFKQAKHAPIEGQTTIEPHCVFWNFQTSNWSDDGCQTTHNSEGITTCTCDHLTNFAVILNIIDLDDATTEVLRLLTLIGCALSAVGLIGTMFFFRTLNSNEYNDRVRINEQFCGNLLVVQILIFFGMDQTDYPLVCKAVALGLQYFLLVSFAWSLFAGHQIYVLLIEVFESEAKRMKQYFGLGYGIPFALIMISLIVDHASLQDQTYGTDQACWMSPNPLFYVNFLAPIFLVTLINVVMLSLVIVKVFRIHPRPHFYSQARGWLSLALFLGVTWVLGLLAKVSSSYFLAVTFAVLNAFQGFLIFCFHVVLGSKLRDIVKRKIKLHSDFSDDSRRNHTVQKSNESGTLSLS